MSILGKLTMKVNAVSDVVAFVKAVCFVAFVLDAAIAFPSEPIRLGVGGSSALRSPVEAVETVRALRAKGECRPVEIDLAPGEYRFAETLLLDARDSDVTWRAAGGGVVFTRARKIAVRDGGGESNVKAASFPCGAPPPPREQVFAQDRAQAPMFFFDEGRWAVSARWPNEDEGWATIEGSVVTGINGREISGILPTLPSGPGVVRLATDRPARWDFRRGIYMAGYFTHDWAFEHVRLHSFDATSNLLVTAGTSAYGFGGSTWDGGAKRRFYAYNVREELDAPCEYWYDRNSQRVEFIPPADWKGTLRGVAEFGPVVRLEGASCVVFDGVGFAYAVGGGVEVESCADIVLRRCTVRDVGGDAVRIREGRDVVVEDCELVRLGGAGVEMSGGVRRTLTPARHAVRRTRIHDYGRVRRTYAPGVRCFGVGNEIVACRIYDAPHCGVLYGGNDHQFVSNEVFAVLLETGDAGAFYAGRDPTSYGNRLAFNHVHDLGRRKGVANTMAFYLDDCDCGDTVVSNLIERVSRGFMLGGGQDNVIVGNTFVDCEIGLSGDLRGLVWDDRWDSPTDYSWQMTRKVRELPVTEEPWKSRFPSLATYLDRDPRAPLGNVVRDNRMIRCRKPFVCEMLPKGMTGYEYYDFSHNQIEPSDDLLRKKENR